MTEPREAAGHPDPAPTRRAPAASAAALDRRRAPPAGPTALLVAVVAALTFTAAAAGAATRAATTPSVTTFQVGAQPDRVVVGAGAVWAGDVGDLIRVDPRTGALRRVPDAATPIAVGDGAVWARALLRFDTVERLDPSTDAVVATISLPGLPAAIAAGPTAVWIVDSTGVLTRIDPATNTVAATIPLGVLGFGVASTPTAIWASGQTPDGTFELWRVDPATNAVVATLDTSGPCSPLASAGEATWAQCGVAQHVDPTSNQLVATSTSALNGLAVGPRTVYALDGDGHLTGIDAQTGQARPILDVPALAEGLALGAGALWITDPGLVGASALHGTGTLLRVRDTGGGP